MIGVEAAQEVLLRLAAALMLAMTRPGTRRSTSAVRPCGRSSKSRPGMKTSEEAETGGGAVTTTGGRVASSGRGVGGDSCGFGWVSGVFAGGS